MSKNRRIWMGMILWIALVFTACSGGKKPELTVYPTPHSVEWQGQWINLRAGGYQPQGIEQKDSIFLKPLDQIIQLNEKSKKLFSVTALQSDDAALQRSGAYRLSIDKHGIHVEIVDRRSLFYAAQTLCQLVKKGRLPICQITDYPDLAFRGVVEGFYGIPWSFENRVSQLRFYGQMKLNTYIYGPKDDPYHRAKWRTPYPEKEAKELQALIEEADRNCVDFVWALHPGMDIRWTNEDRAAALHKLEAMYDLGVRSFAVFFDDIDGEGTDAAKQAAFLNYLKEAFVDAKGDIQQLTLCPTEYNKDWATSDYLDVLGENLDPFIQIMWTGDKVVSEITAEGLQWVNKRIKRPCYVWWNFPVNDYVPTHLLMGPAYGLDKQSGAEMKAFVSNPMEHAEASKVALYSIAQFAWNSAVYDPDVCWEQACEYLVPEAPEAFKIFCEHNADVGPNAWLFEREESFRTKPLLQAFEEELVNNPKYPKKMAVQLQKLFAEIEEVPASLRATDHQELLREIDPWLTQTAHIAKAGLCTMEMLNKAGEEDVEACRMAYKEVKATLDTIAVFNREHPLGEDRGIRTGEQVLLPFIHQMLRYVEDKLLPDERPAELPEVLKGSKAEEELACYKEDDMIGLKPHFKPIQLAPGEYIGFKIEKGNQPTSLVYDLRRNKANKRSLQGSVDGKVWFTFFKKGADRLDTIPIHDKRVRYIRLINQSKEETQVGVGRFSVLVKPNKATSSKAN